LPDLEFISKYLHPIVRKSLLGIFYIIFFLLSAVAVCQQPDRAIIAGFSSWQYSGSYVGPNAPSAGFFFGFKTNKARYFNTRLEIGYGKAQGQSNEFANLYGNNGLGPSSSFQTEIYYGEIDLNFNFYKSKSLTFYVSAGIGILRFEPKDGLGQTLASLNPTRMQGELYSQSALWVPIGVGFNYWIPNGPGLGLQVAFQNPATDYLDNVKQYNSVPDQLLTGKFSIYIPLKGSPVKDKPIKKPGKKKRLNN